MAIPWKLLLGTIHRTAFKARFAWRSRNWEPASFKTRPATDRIIVSGFFSEALGIGRAGQLVADKLEEIGFDVLREDLRPFDKGLLTQPAKPFFEIDGVNTWLIEANPPEAKIALFSHDYKAWRNLYRIGFWHWESDLAPADWVTLAPYFHEIWVSSVFTRDALAKAMCQAGLEDQVQKLSVHPLPVTAKPKMQPVISEQIRPAGIKVITIFDPRSHFERKNPEAVIATWLRLFPEPANEACLIIKALSNAETHRLFAPLKAKAQDRPDIEFICETLSESATAQLITDCDILISLHRGEGYGLTLAEAMANGVSVIATGWSGNTQFMTTENSILVPFNLIPANPLYNGPKAKWAEPIVSIAADGLKSLMMDRDLRKRLSGQARSDIASIDIEWQKQCAYLPGS